MYTRVLRQGIDVGEKGLKEVVADTSALFFVKVVTVQ
jgi:hypothetical protein